MKAAFDASALLTYLHNEPGSDAVEAVFARFRHVQRQLGRGCAEVHRRTDRGAPKSGQFDRKKDHVFMLSIQSSCDRIIALYGPIPTFAFNAMPSSPPCCAKVS